LIGDEACARVAIRPAHGDALARLLLRAVPWLGHHSSEPIPERLVESFGRLVFNGLIQRVWGGEVTFLVPDSLGGLRRLA
jgi:hypothetical protein